MPQIDIKIAANPSKYCALLAFVDNSGEEHVKEIDGSRTASRDSNTIQALTEAIEALNRPCMLDIYTDNDYIVSALRAGWLQGWKRNGWQTAKGREIANLEQWKRLDQLLARHTIKIIKVER